jgi:hypothetical protein
LPEERAGFLDREGAAAVLPRREERMEAYHIERFGTATPDISMRRVISSSPAGSTT